MEAAGSVGPLFVLPPPPPLDELFAAPRAFFAPPPPLRCLNRPTAAGRGWFPVIEAAGHGSLLDRPRRRWMDFALSPEQQAVRDAVARICARFDDAYWLERDREGGFPHELHRALADDGWLGICIPEEHGGSGLGIAEAAV